MPENVDALLFDLGGVVIEIDFERVFQAWSAASGVPASRLRSRFQADSFYERHERGEITAEAYFGSLRASLAIDLSNSQFEAGWNAIFKGEVPGIAAVLRQLQGRIPLYVFSNSNRTHQAFWSKQYAHTLNAFQRIFVSSDIGRRKPEPGAFAAVLSEIAVPPQRILFFDDTQENVEGARRAGMRAIHVKSPADVKGALGALLR